MVPGLETSNTWSARESSTPTMEKSRRFSQYLVYWEGRHNPVSCDSFFSAIWLRNTVASTAATGSSPQTAARTFAALVERLFQLATSASHALGPGKLNATTTYKVACVPIEPASKWPLHSLVSLSRLSTYSPASHVPRFYSPAGRSRLAIRSLKRHSALPPSSRLRPVLSFESATLVRPRSATDWGSDLTWRAAGGPPAFQGSRDLQPSLGRVDLALGWHAFAGCRRQPRHRSSIKTAR